MKYPKSEHQLNHEYPCDDLGNIPSVENGVPLENVWLDTTDNEVYND